MAFSGLCLLGFVMGHLAGNLSVFGGPNALNSYAKKLQNLGPLLWVARIFLLTMISIHIVSSIQLVRENRSARPVPNQKKLGTESSLGAHTMMLSGLVILAFVIFHLLHFTFRVTHPEISHLKDALGRHDVYSMLVLSFQQWPVALSYVAAMFLLSLHLGHASASMLQTLGLTNESTLPKFQKAGRIFAILIFIGYASIPLACITGLVQPAGGI